MHDNRDGDKTLNKFVKHVGAMDVFDVFFDYNRVISQDQKQSAETFYKEENIRLNRYPEIRKFPESTNLYILFTFF